MARSGIKLAILASWLASMSWLMVAKILPPLRQGEPPDHHSMLPGEVDTPPPVCWRIRYREQAVGWAATRPLRRPDGAIEILSRVEFVNLPLTQITGDLLGPIGQFAGSILTGPHGWQTDMTVRSRVLLDPLGNPLQFESQLGVGDVLDLVTVQGALAERKLRLTVFSRINDADDRSALGREVFRDEVDLPREALITDAFSLRWRLNNLRPGQSWTFPVVRPFPPGSKPEIIEAVVEHDEAILSWEGRPVRTMLVVYRRDAGSGLTAAREPIGRAWVLASGEILQQEVRLAKLRLIFERLPEQEASRQLQRLDAEWH